MIRLFLVALLLFQPLFLAAKDNLPCRDNTCVLFHFDDVWNGANSMSEKGGVPLTFTGDVLRTSKTLASGNCILVGRQGANGYGLMNPGPSSLPTGDASRYYEFVVSNSSPMFADYQYVATWNGLNEIVGFYNFGALSNCRLKINSLGVSIIEWNTFGDASVHTADNIGVTGGSVNYFCIAYQSPNVTFYKYTDGVFSTAAVRSLTTQLNTASNGSAFYIGGHDSQTQNYFRGFIDEFSISTGTISPGEVADHASRIFGKYRRANDE